LPPEETPELREDDTNENDIGNGNANDKDSDANDTESEDGGGTNDDNGVNNDSFDDGHSTMVIEVSTQGATQAIRDSSRFLFA
jgi:hypothetical protein